MAQDITPVSGDSAFLNFLRASQERVYSALGIPRESVDAASSAPISATEIEAIADRIRRAEIQVGSIVAFRNSVRSEALGTVVMLDESRQLVHVATPHGSTLEVPLAGVHLARSAADREESRQEFAQVATQLSQRTRNASETTSISPQHSLRDQLRTDPQGRCALQAIRSSFRRDYGRIVTIEEILSRGAFDLREEFESEGVVGDASGIRRQVYTARRYLDARIGGRYEFRVQIVGSRDRPDAFVVSHEYNPVGFAIPMGEPIRENVTTTTFRTGTIMLQPGESFAPFPVQESPSPAVAPAPASTRDAPSYHFPTSKGRKVQIPQSP